MRRPMLLIPVLASALVAAGAPAQAATAAKPSGCTVGAKRTLSFAVKGDRVVRRYYYLDGKILEDRTQKVRSNIKVARIGLTIRACKTKQTKEWRTLDVYAAPSYETQQRDLITTVKPSGDTYAVTLRPRTGTWGLGAFPGARTENAVTTQSTVCTKTPAPLSDVALSAAHGLLNLPIPLPLAGVPGAVAEVGLFAADAALPTAGPDQFQCGDAGTVSLPWGFTRSGTPKHTLKKSLRNYASASRPCTVVVNPRYDSCSESTLTTWTYSRG